MTSVQEGKTEYTKSTNVAAERAVLAGLCKWGTDAFVLVDEIVDMECFTSDINQIFYKCITSIFETSESIDLPSVIAMCTVLGFGDTLNSKTNADYARSLFNYNVSLENCIKNAKLIKKLDCIRKGQDKAKEIYVNLSKLNGSETITSIISTIEQPVFEYTKSIASNDEDETGLIGDGIDEHIDYLETERPSVVGIPSPWPIYNEAIGGGRRRGGVYLIAARPKVGKSSFCINDALHVAGLGIPVLYLDSEMDKKSQIPRILASLSTQTMKSVEHGDFVTNDFHHAQIKTAAGKLKEMPLYYRSIAGKPFDEIISIIRRWVIKNVGIENGATRNCIIMYDYFKLTDSSDLDKMSEHQALGFQIQELADLCKEYDVTCSAYVQMNRNGITKETTDVLSQSDRLLWLCASLALLKRKSIDEILTAGSENGNMKLIVTEEQRFGPGLSEGDWINFVFDKDRCQIKELNTKNGSYAGSGNSSGGFSTVVIDGQDDSDGFTDEDFDTPAKAYRDDSQRKN